MNNLTTLFNYLDEQSRILLLISQSTIKIVRLLEEWEDLIEVYDIIERYKSTT